MNTKHHILIVDDDRDFRENLSGILRDEGYPPVTAENGKEAMERIRESDIAVALIDLRLEDMSGLDVMKGIKKCSPMTEGIFITGYASRASAIDAVNLAAYSYVKKPFHVGQLLATIRMAIEKREVRKALQKSEERLRIKNKIAGIFLSTPDNEMYGQVLEVVLKAMKSKYGIFGYIDEKGSLNCPSMTKNVWDKCRMSDKTLVYPRNTWRGIWGKALIDKKSLYSNEPFKVPEGHVPIFRALDVPIVHQGEIIGNLLMGNKETDYDAYDKQLLEGIVRYIAPVLHARLERDREEKERERLASQLRKTQKMEAISTLAGGIAHDFNNILSAIIGFGQLAQMELDPESKVYGYLGEVLQSGNRAKLLIQQILAVGRSQEQEKQPVQFKYIVNTTAYFFVDIRK